MELIFNCPLVRQDDADENIEMALQLLNIIEMFTKANSIFEAKDLFEGYTSDYFIVKLTNDLKLSVFQSVWCEKTENLIEGARVASS